MILADKVSDEHHGVPDEEAAGHQWWGGQPHKVLARGVVHTTGLFRAKIVSKTGKFNLNIHALSI